MDIERIEAPLEGSLQHGRDFWVNPWNLFGVSEAADANAAQKIGRRYYRRMVKLYYPDIVTAKANTNELTDGQRAECLRRYDLLCQAWGVFKDEQSLAYHRGRIAQTDLAICNDLRNAVYPDGQVVSLGVELPDEYDNPSTEAEHSLGVAALSSVLVRQRMPGHVSARYDHSISKSPNFDLSL